MNECVLVEYRVFYSHWTLVEIFERRIVESQFSTFSKRNSTRCDEKSQKITNQCIKLLRQMMCDCTMPFYTKIARFTFNFWCRFLNSAFSNLDFHFYRKILQILLPEYRTLIIIHICCALNYALWRASLIVAMMVRK